MHVGDPVGRTELAWSYADLAAASIHVQTAHTVTIVTRTQQVQVAPGEEPRVAVKRLASLAGAPTVALLEREAAFQALVADTLQRDDAVVSSLREHATYVTWPLRVSGAIDTQQLESWLVSPLHAAYNSARVAAWHPALAGLLLAVQAALAVALTASCCRSAQPTPRRAVAEPTRPAVPQPRRGRRLAALDGLRGVACLTVIIHHAVMLFYPVPFYTQRRFPIPIVDSLHVPHPAPEPLRPFVEQVLETLFPMSVGSFAVALLFVSGG